MLVTLRRCASAASRARALHTASPYHVLGVSPQASKKEIRRAYLAQARVLHPDNWPRMSENLKKQHSTGGVHGESGTKLYHSPKALEEAFKDLQAAWEVLGDPERRQRYDLHGCVEDWEPTRQERAAAETQQNWREQAEPVSWFFMFGNLACASGMLVAASWKDIVSYCEEHKRLQSGGWPCEHCLWVNEAVATTCSRCGRAGVAQELAQKYCSQPGAK